MDCERLSRVIVETVEMFSRASLSKELPRIRDHRVLHSCQRPKMDHPTTLVTSPIPCLATANAWPPGKRPKKKPAMSPPP